VWLDYILAIKEKQSEKTMMAECSSTIMPSEQIFALKPSKNIRSSNVFAELLKPT